MRLDPHEVPDMIVSLIVFFSENPRQKLPIRYIRLLVKIINDQLTDHPSVTYDLLDNMTYIKASEKHWKSDEEEESSTNN